MKAAKKHLEVAMAEHRRVSGVFAEKREAFEQAQRSLQTQRAAYSKTAAAAALGEQADVKGASAKVDQARADLSALGLVVDGIEGRLEIASKALAAAIESYQGALQLAKTELGAELAQEWRDVVEKVIYPTLLRLMALGSADFPYDYSEIMRFYIPGFFSGKSEMFQFINQRINPETLQVENVPPYASHPELVKLAAERQSFQQLLTEAVRQLGEVAKPEKLGESREIVFAANVTSMVC